MKKLTGNGLWESSRMMLFEHKDAIISKQEHKQIQKRPVLDEQQTERIAEKLSQAYRSKQQVQVLVFGDYGSSRMRGMISRIDPQLQRIRLGNTWISLSDILDVSGENERFASETD
ncbi:YolD-like family protein [Paenibacillus lemnae]|uniref:YolD-like family protein n=1 Tax=Paenibacillus lemnae TaxID=1330551 RepID=A0A848M2W4_PAELE|nr:YolD-like family protein [Paenibacillus lemnae]NMO94609.1 YolD-like family protein [Paenibacillus lemnae]